MWVSFRQLVRHTGGHGSRKNKKKEVFSRGWKREVWQNELVEKKESRKVKQRLLLQDQRICDLS